MNGMKYPNRLRALRNRSGLTQEQVAARFECSTPCYQNYEYGKREMKAGVLRRAARVFGCSVEDVLGIEADWIDRKDAARGASVPVVNADGDKDPREAAWESSESWYVPLPVYKKHAGSFYLRIDSLSVNRLIPKGALVLVDPDAEISSGDLTAIRLEGEGITIQRIFWAGNTVVLHPESQDPELVDFSFDRTRDGSPALELIGRVVSYAAPEDWRP